MGAASAAGLSGVELDGAGEAEAEGLLDGDVEEAELLQLLGPGQGADVERRRPPSAASWASFCRGAFWDELGDFLGRGGPSLRGALEVIHQRHERFDGHGYPDGLAGEQISLAARIVAVVDVWDALTSAAPARTDGGINGHRCPRGWSQPVGHCVVPTIPGGQLCPHGARSVYQVSPTPARPT